jgi:hypothetical protein
MTDHLPLPEDIMNARLRLAGAAIGAVVLGLTLAPAASAQDAARLQLPSFEALAKRATETVDITLDPSLLRLAANFMTDHDADEAAVKELLQGLQGIYVRSYEFDEVGVYSQADIDAVRAQLGKGAWTRLVSVKSAREGSESEVYSWIDKGVSNGLAIVSAEPRSFTIVNIVGRIDLDKLRHLEGQFGIPKVPTAEAKPGKQ